MKNVIFISTFFLSILYTDRLLGEVVRDTSGKPFQYNGQVSQQDRSQANGIASGLIGDPGSIKRDENAAPSNGGEGSADRAYKAGNARNQGRTGVAEAIVSSAALHARGSALELPAPGVAAALHAMGALEMAQAIATGATASDNDDQQKLLLKNEAQGGQGYNRIGSSGATRSVNINSPQLDAFLAKQGVNAENFKAQLANGSLNNLPDILDAMGVSSIVKESDLKQAERIATKTIKELPENETTLGDKGTVTGNESARPEGERSGASGGAAVASIGAAGGANEMTNQGAVIENMTAEERAHAIELANAQSGGAGAAGEVTMSDFLKKFTDDNKKGILDRKLTEYEIQLEKANVFPSTGKYQIFQIAHRNYREYGKWRKNAKKLAVR